MILFYLKKNFTDGWDNMLHSIVVNFVILVYVILAVSLTNVLLGVNLALGVFSAIVFFAAGSAFVFAYGTCAAEIANFGSPSIKDYFHALPKAAKDGFLFGLLYGCVLFAGGVGISMYLSMANTVGFLCAVFLFWVEIIAVLAFQWFLPIRSLMHNSFKKCLKKSFIIFFDNIGFSVFIGIYTIFLLLLSVFLFFLIPSFSGITLAHVNALRLRLYKYDWLEEHPQFNVPKKRNNIPWDELLEKDKEMVGPRPLKSFIFPWKY